MKTRACAMLLLATAVLVAGDAQPLLPHQGTVVISATDVRLNVWILEETMEGVKHTLGDKQESGETRIARGKYLRVDYSDPNEAAWLKGARANNLGKFEDAATLFIEASTTSRSWHAREDAFMRAAQCWLKAGKPDQAIVALDGLKAAFPKHVRQTDALYMYGQAQAKKGDAAAAQKTYNDLAKRNDLGADAMVLGSLGQAELLAADKKPGDAVAILAPVFAKLDPGQDAKWFGNVGSQLAQQQSAAGQADPAIATVRRLAYGVGDPTIRARAHLDWAQLLLNAGNTKSLFLAFDHAAIASAVRDADSTVTEQGGNLTRKLSGLIDKLPADQCSDAEKAEYRRYLTR